ncbi:autotransporter assembly complex family protein [uncultured Algimonas sp.]|uniref:autotransporter assembly complex protein TamA n=1 Tax=uncultured Algimonas sp. TaxID=1547920 RepID=UPI002616AEE8|nr:autotransporter assembly complex family protein [uncultured Algimonas sp.]
MILWLLAGAGRAAAYPVKIIYEGDVPEEIRDNIDSRLPDEPDAESPLHARRQARRAENIVEGIFNAFGYYDPTIETAVVGDGEQARPELTVDPGAQFSVRRLEIRYDGEPPREADLEEARAAISLQPGMPAVAAEVIDQERQIGAALRELGYPYAQTTQRDVIGDRDAKTISVRYTVDAGSRVRFGRMIYPDDIRTQDRYLDRINPLEKGELYDPSDLALFNSRLAETRLFDSSLAKLTDEPVGMAEDGAEIRDVELLLNERKRNTLTLGAGFDTSEGFGVDAELLRRNLTRRGDLLVANARIAQREFGLNLVWRRPNELGFGKGLSIYAGASDEDTDAFNQQTGTLGVGVEVIEGPIFQYSYGAEARYIRQSGESDRRDFQVIALNGSARIDRADSLLDPRKGWRAEGQLKPTYSFSPDGPDVPYVRAVAQGRLYLPLSAEGRFVAAGRLRLGTLVGTTVRNVPGDDRFYSGGGGSVRGYAFQAIGPFDANNVPLGGRSLAEASIEGRARITDRIGAVAFLDAGNVSDAEYPAFDNLRVGLGAGVRYMTPAGPLRLDVAIPLNPSDRDEAFQIYISIGQAF